MKRDIDLVRAVLLALEANDDVYSTGPTVPGATASAIRYHLKLLVDAGLISNESIQDPETCLKVAAYRLSWEGHEFLDSAREPKRWAKAKGLIEGAGGVALDVAKELLIKLAREQLGL